MNVVPVSNRFPEESYQFIVPAEVTALKVEVPELQTAVAVADVIVGNGFTVATTALLVDSQAPASA
jgi:hypothetical protein